MTRTIPYLLAALLLTGCGSGTSTASSSTPPASATTASAQPKPAKTCKVTRDLIVWTKTPGGTSAQTLGDVSLATCETTLDMLKETSPTGPGNCTIAAWADDNPGYNVDAATPRRPKKAVETIGAC